MSTSNDFLIDAPISLDDLSVFLKEVCDMTVKDVDRFGRPIHQCREFLCYLSQPNEIQLQGFQKNLRFAPTWRMETWFFSTPYHDPHPKLVETMRWLLMEYNCNLAWLVDCSQPVLVKLNRKVTVQGDIPRYSSWSAYLNQIAREIGFPFDTAFMPAF